MARTDVNATSMATNPTGEALIKAAEEGRTDDVKALLKAGADVHSAGPVGAARPTGAPARVTPSRRAGWWDGAQGVGRLFLHACQRAAAAR